MVRICPPVMWAMRAPCAVVGGGGTNGSLSRAAAAEGPGGGPDRRRSHLPIAAVRVAAKAQARHRGEAQRCVQQPGRVEEGVAVEPAEAGKLGLLQARNGPEDAHLLAVLQLGLESDHVVERAEPV